MKIQTRKQFFSIVSMLVIFTACSSSKNSQQPDIVQPGHWQSNTLFINGDDSDWVKPLMYLDTKQNLAYTVSNDKDNLYILASTNNETTIQRILSGGLTVYLNNHGVKDEPGAGGISFPTGKITRQANKMMNDRPEYRNNKHVALDAVQDYSLFGFNTIKTQQNFDYGKANAEGIEVGIGLNNAGELVYKAMVPLSAFLNKSDISNAGRKSFTIGFVLEPLPPQSGSRGGGGGVSIGGGIGMGSFGSGGGIGVSIGSGALGRIGGGRNNRQVKIWREIMLAKTPIAGK